MVVAKVSRASTASRCPSIKKKLFDDADPELTLNLLKITKESELEIQRSDSEFMQDYNSTSKQQQERLSTAHIIISTEGSDNVSLDAPNLEQAYSMLGVAATQSTPF